MSEERKDVGFFEYFLESKKLTPHSVMALGLSALAMLMTLYFLMTAYFGAPVGIAHRLIFVLFVLLFAFFLFPTKRKKWYDKFNWFFAWDLFLALCTLGVGIYFLSDLNGWQMRFFQPSVADTVAGTFLIALVLIVTRRTVGTTMTVVAAFFILHTRFANYFPGFLKTVPTNWKRMVDVLVSDQGVLSEPIQSMASYIILFLVFGALLEQTGAGRYFIDLAYSIGGRFTAGPAKTAAISSALFGSISGSSVSNVVSTGCFTIPLMKRIGYEPEFAAAVEACSSTGGQIVPPVMGTAAFLMADYIGMPYKYIMLAAILPCILYYFSIFVAVHLRAKRKGLRGLEKSECPDVKKALKERGHLILPFVLVIYMICAGYSAVHSGFWGIVSTVAVAQLRKTTRMSFRDIIDALISGAKRSISVAVACACVGFIVGIVSLTGVGNVLGNYILILAGGKLLPTCFLAMLLSILLGMGLPCTGVYIVMATIVAPALVRLNVPIVAAHLFCFYFGIMASITPPVAIAAYAGAGIAQCNPAKAGWISFRIAIPSLMIPYVFVYNSSILLVTGMGVMETVTTLVSATCGIVLMCIAFERYASRYCDKLAAWKAVCVGVGGFMMIVPGILTDILGIAIAAVMIVPTVLVNRRKELASE